jgi:hypothetical protein
MKLNIIAILIGSIAALNVSAQDFRSGKVITTAVPSLRIPPDARAGGMGETGIGTSADANSGFRNLAKTPFASEQSALAVNYTPWMRDVTNGMYLLSFAGYHRPDTLQSISASIRYFNLGDFALQDHNGNLLQTSRPHDLLIDIGYARRLSGKIGVGIALRYISSSLANGTVDGVTYKPGETVAGDVSLYYHGLKGFSAGLALTNLGARISYTNGANKEFLPANLGIGAAYTTIMEEQHSITIAADVNKLLVPALGDKDYYNTGIVESWGKSFKNNAYQYSLGLEYTYMNRFNLRTGYFLESKEQGNRKGLTAGVGVRYSELQLDLSYIAPSGNGTTRSPLSNTLRLGVQLNIN